MSKHGFLLPFFPANVSPSAIGVQVSPAGHHYCCLPSWACDELNSHSLANRIARAEYKPETGLGCEAEGGRS